MTCVGGSTRIQAPLLRLHRTPRDHCGTNTHDQDVLNHRGDDTTDQQERYGPTENVSAVIPTVAEHKRRTSPQKSQDTENNTEYHVTAPSG